MTALKRLTVDPSQLSAVLEELTQALLDGQWIQLQAPKGDASEGLRPVPALKARA